MSLFGGPFGIVFDNVAQSFSGGKSIFPQPQQAAQAAPVRVASATPTTATDASPASSGTGTGGSGGGGTGSAVTSAPPVQSQPSVGGSSSSPAPVANRDDTKRSRGIVMDNMKGAATPSPVAAPDGSVSGRGVDPLPARPDSTAAPAATSTAPTTSKGLPQMAPTPGAQVTSRAGTGTSSTGGTADYGQALAGARARYAEELKNPSIRRQLFARVESENGGAGATAQIESIVNRAIARGQSLETVLGGSYWAKDGTANMQRMLASGSVPDYSKNLDEVMGGSNVTSFATGNASYAPNNPEFNKYPFGRGGEHTQKVNGELYGQEAGTVGWYKKLGINVSGSDASVSAGTASATGAAGEASAGGPAGTASATGPAGTASAVAEPQAGSAAQPDATSPSRKKTPDAWQTMSDILSGFSGGESSQPDSGGSRAMVQDVRAPESVSPVSAPNLVATGNFSALRGVLDGIA